MTSPLLSTLNQLEIPLHKIKEIEVKKLKYKIAQFFYKTKPKGCEALFTAAADTKNNSNDNNNNSDGEDIGPYSCSQYTLVEFPITCIHQSTLSTSSTTKSSTTFVSLPIVFRVVHILGVKEYPPSLSFDKINNALYDIDIFGVVDEDGAITLERSKFLTPFILKYSKRISYAIKIKETQVDRSELGPLYNNTNKTNKTNNYYYYNPELIQQNQSLYSSRSLHLAQEEFIKQEATLIIQVQAGLYLSRNTSNIRLSILPIHSGHSNSDSTPSSPSSPSSTSSSSTSIPSSPLLILPPSPSPTSPLFSFHHINTNNNNNINTNNTNNETEIENEQNNIEEPLQNHSTYTGFAFRAMSTTQTADDCGPYFGITGVFIPCLGGIYCGQEFSLAAACSIWFSSCLSLTPSELFARFYTPTLQQEYTEYRADLIKRYRERKETDELWGFKIQPPSSRFFSISENKNSTSVQSSLSSSFSSPSSPSSSTTESNNNSSSKTLLQSTHIVEVLAFLLDFNGQSIITPTQLKNAQKYCSVFFGSAETSKLQYPNAYLSGLLSTHAKLTPLPSGHYNNNNNHNHNHDHSQQQDEKKALSRKISLPEFVSRDRARNNSISNYTNNNINSDINIYHNFRNKSIKSNSRPRRRSLPTWFSSLSQRNKVTNPHFKPLSDIEHGVHGDHGNHGNPAESEKQESGNNNQAISDFRLLSNSHPQTSVFKSKSVTSSPLIRGSNNNNNYGSNFSLDSKNKNDEDILSSNSNNNNNNSNNNNNNNDNNDNNDNTSQQTSSLLTPLFTMSVFRESIARVPWFDFIQLVIFEDLSSKIVISDLLQLPSVPNQSWRMRLEKALQVPQRIQQLKTLQNREKRMRSLRLTHDFS